jgi:L-alanine-DL-glutamate epimerase-like enolase superfamily enzyme|tara:strand:- start:136 stop:309 length:174 start_codon:yes stop_codon:yes gene_type:complete
MIEDVFERCVKDKDPIQWEKGYVIPSNKPGLGVELNEDIANKYSYTGTKLHLEMTEI